MNSIDTAGTSYETFGINLVTTTATIGSAREVRQLCLGEHNREPIGMDGHTQEVALIAKNAANASPEGDAPRAFCV